MIVSNLDNLDEHVKLSKDYHMGFELNDFIYPDVCDDENKVNEIVASYKAAGLPEICTMHGEFLDVYVASMDPVVRENSKKRMVQSMEIARKIGVRGVVFHTNINPWIKTEEYITSTVETLSEYVEKLLKEYEDIDIYLENMFDDSPRVLIEISNRLKGYKNYGICFDYAHATLSKTPIEEWVQAVAPFVKHVHINDNDKLADLHQAVGDGKIDWSEFRKYYREYFKDCTVLIETTPPKYQRRSVFFLQMLGIMPGGVKESLELPDWSRDEKSKKKRPYNESAEELLGKIFGCMTNLLEATEFSATVSMLTDLGSGIVHADRASFWFWDKKQKSYWTLAATGNAKITTDENKGIVGRAMRENQTIICNQPYEDPDFNVSVDEATGYVTHSILCMPIHNSGGDVIGAFQVLNKIDQNGEISVFDEDDTYRLSLVGAFCAKTLESNLLHNEAYVDELTGLKNRYAFYEYYNTHIIRQMKDTTMTIIMCDIDHFKKVNDTYGHNEGDEVLKTVAKVLKKNTGVNDVVVRWGGEEFIIVLNDCDVEQGYNIAQKLRTTMEVQEFEYEGTQFHVTMSFGVSDVSRERSVEDNVKLADEKLYIAKKTGRNKVVV